MNCSRCGTPLQSGWVACPKCGQQFAPTLFVSAPTKRPSALLLGCLGCGVLGLTGVFLVLVFIGAVAKNGNQGSSYVPVTNDATDNKPSLPKPSRSLLDDYNSANIGDSKGQVFQLMGRSPDFTYAATDGSGATVFQYKDADVDVLRFMIVGDTVSKVTYVPASGLDNMLIKGG